MALWRLRAKTWMSNILKEILSRSMSTTMIHSNAIKSPFHSHGGVKTGLVHINTSILGKTVVCCFIGVTICNQSYNNYKPIPSTMYNSWTQFALGFWVNTPIEHFYNSLPTNSLAWSPGPVKLDSDKWKLWKNLF
jgi:hypothetical protein